MSEKLKNIASFDLAGTKKGKVVVNHMDEPYGASSKPVVSIGISLKGSLTEADWKAHIPYENIDDLIKALEQAKAEFNK
ncbi:MAG: hypothetical protein M0P02_05965 [Sulfurospirillaceae bacterium]|jgi:ribosome-associated translation inhibitor RaiA|nr:hypothetical protein [Sulfurospirillaceae bacterium]MCK9546514.1 hypothetical protein [Sulfurospirillaceae bacterium]MDY0238808.1 hypothetical protein [Campylobacterales bacterium]